MKPVADISSDMLFNDTPEEGVFGGELLLYEITGARSGEIKNQLLPARFDAYSMVLVARGEMTMSIDFKPYAVKKNSIIEFFSHHVIDNIRISPDYKSYHMLIGRDLFELLMSRTGLMSRNNIHPERFQLVRSVEDDEMRDLMRILERIRVYMADKSHNFGKEIVKSELSTFLLEFGNICLKRVSKKQAGAYESEQKEDIVSRFVKLLIDNCRKESEVSFYSTELCITPEHLSRVIKSMSGKSVNIWIREARLSEAKILLRQHDATIQQVADELAFSDQSSFGKFFKKHTGKSPLEYRREILS